MSDPQEHNDDRDTVEGVDPDLGVSTSPAEDEDAQDNAEPSTEDPVDVEDLP
ncbi:MAG: hypothetical protein ACTH8F_14700 [Microbacterium sp.]|uniref:hypothetical protein n=1 Tax=Microbacterium sp. TaxID=51671 RepID=UPI003F9C7171